MDCFSALSNLSSKNITPKEEDVEKLMQNWNLPEVPIHHIYKRGGIFESNPNYEIGTTEKRVIIQGEYQDLQLHDLNSIQRWRNYDYLHMGFVQVAIKPLTTNGMNNSVLVALRDNHILLFNYSRLAIAEVSLNNGPVYFNCYPSYTASFADSHIDKTLTPLTLNLKIHGYNSENPGSRDIEVVHKMYYKLMKGFADPKKRKSLVRGYTTFIETNVASDNVAVEKITDWDSIEIPERWSVSLQQ